MMAKRMPFCALLQVAILFLTRGKMPLEPAWREFFAAAALLEPIDVDRLWTPDVVAPRNVDAELAAIDERDAAAARRGATVTLPVDPRKVGSAVATAARRAGARAGSDKVGRRQNSGSRVHSKGSGAATRRPLWSAWTGWWASKPDVIAAQDLFSVYVHPPPGRRFRASSLFSGREVPDRVAVSWAQNSVVRCPYHVISGITTYFLSGQTRDLLVSHGCSVCPSRHTSLLQAEAERRLLRAALADPANQRFLLASETCLPVYPPHVLYSELVNNGRSRIHACKLDTWEEQKRRNDWKCAPCWRKAIKPMPGLMQGSMPP